MIDQTQKPEAIIEEDISQSMPSLATQKEEKKDFKQSQLGPVIPIKKREKEKEEEERELFSEKEQEEEESPKKSENSASEIESPQKPEKVNKKFAQGVDLKADVKGSLSTKKLKEIEGLEVEQNGNSNSTNAHDLESNQLREEVMK